MNVLTNLLAQTVVRNEPIVDDGNMAMGVIAWLVCGLVAGFLASKIVNKRGEGILMDIVLGLVGSFVGGFIVHALGFRRDGSLIVSIVIATLGAVLVLVVYHKLILGGRRRSA
jgi:uncharacterized membrane protein YeaQ/YmgE (transglycosylase-associated protein family)